MTDPHARFDEALAARAPHLRCRPEEAADSIFLTGLAIACSPLAAMLPEPMLRQQVEFQHASHNGAHPHAMHRIATLGAAPVGRIMIDWDGHETHLVDIAVLPAHHGAGIGSAMLSAWLDVADARRQSARLEVRADNPAARLYQRLGFQPVLDPNDWSPVVTMSRPAV